MIDTPKALNGIGGKALDFDVPVTGPTEPHLITRRRDEDGNPAVEMYVYDIPYQDNVPLQQTGLAGLLERIEQSGQNHKVVADNLRYWYQDRLCPAAARLKATIAEEKARFARAVERVTHLSDELDNEQAHLRDQRDAKLNLLRERYDQCEKAIEEAQVQAVDAAAKAGVAYDPETPDAAIAKLAPEPDLGVAAAENQLPWAEDEENTLLDKQQVWVVTILIGAFLGISIGLVAGILQAASLAHNWQVAAVLAVLGFAPAVTMRYMVIQAFMKAAETVYSGRPMTYQVGALIWAGAVALLVMAVEAAVEVAGLFKVVDMEGQFGQLGQPGAEASGGGAALALLYPVALVLTLGYIGYSAYEGYRRGRAGVVNNRVHQALERKREEYIEKLREPVVAVALAQIGRVRELQHRRTRAEQQMTQVTNEYEQRLAKVEARRLPTPTGVTPEQKQRIEDALHNLLGAQHEFDRRLERALSTVHSATPQGVVGTGVSQAWQPSKTVKTDKSGLWERLRGFFQRLFN